MFTQAEFDIIGYMEQYLCGGLGILLGLGTIGYVAIRDIRENSRVINDNLEFERRRREGKKHWNTELSELPCTSKTLLKRLSVYGKSPQGVINDEGKRIKNFTAMAARMGYEGEYVNRLFERYNGDVKRLKSHDNKH